MIFRRLIGLALVTLLVQLNFTASDLACAKHGGGSSRSTLAGSAQHHSMAMPSHRASNAAGQSKPCGIPVTRDCCQAVASCSMTFGIAAKASVTELAFDNATASGSTAEAPASLIRGPEPPPPKV